jgi:transposase
MLSFPSTVRIYLCSQPADMRRAFDGLAAMTQQVIGQNPLSGHLFVFVNRRRDRLKILFWDRDGYALWAKRLERGTFRFPEPKGNSLEVTPSELAAILGGIDLNTARRQTPVHAPCRHGHRVTSRAHLIS